MESRPYREASEGDLLKKFLKFKETLRLTMLKSRILTICRLIDRYQRLGGTSYVHQHFTSAPKKATMFSP